MIYEPQSLHYSLITLINKPWLLTLYLSLACNKSISEMSNSILHVSHESLITTIQEAVLAYC